MNNAHPIMALFARQAAEIKAAKISQTKPTPDIALLPDGRLPAVGARSKFAHVLCHHERAVRATSQKARTHPNKAAPKTSRVSGAISERPSFAHLAPAPYPIEGDDTAATATDKARAIVASAAKARSVVPVTKPENGSAAAAILAAAALRDTPSGNGAAKPKGLAADILAAGRKRRGEA